MDQRRRFGLFFPLILTILSAAFAFPPAQSTAQIAPGPAPLVFIPGIMGSYLDIATDTGGRCNIWPGIPRLDCPAFLPKELLLFPPALTIPTDAVRELPLPEDLGVIYRPFLERLTQAAPNGGGYREYIAPGSDILTPLQRCEQARANNRTDVTLFVFAYDWRLDNAASAAQLGALIDCIAAIHPGRPANIVAHSMGGLVARRYILDNPGSHNIQRLITVGTPWLGAPRTLLTMETGWDSLTINILFLLTSQTPGGFPLLRLLAEAFVSIHQLLPSRAYFDLGERPLREDGRDLNGNWNLFNNLNYETFDYQQYVQWTDAHFTIADPAAGNAAFHTAPQDDWSDDMSGVEYVHIYGRGAATDTVGGLRAIWSIGCLNPPVNRTECWWLPGYDVEWTYGDGTVPVVSAARIAGGRNLNAPGVTPVAITTGNVDHTGMLSNPEVQNRILLALQGAPSALTPQAAPPPREVYIATITGMPEITITGASGASINTLNGTHTRPITDVAYLPLSDAMHAAILPTGGVYTITFQSAGTPLLLNVTRTDGMQISAVERYLDVALPLSTTLILRITPAGIEPLRSDSDGDGVFETILTPTASIQGAGRYDTEAPTLTLSLNGSPFNPLVTLAAADSGAGIAHILYSLDGRTFQPYTGPLQIDTTRTPVLYAFADDAAGNRSNLSAFQLARRIYLPSIER